MIDLLTLCGFDESEIESQLPRIEKAFSRLGITAGDIEQGKQRLKKYYDIELQGIRQAIGLSIRDVVDTMLAREEGKKKVLYGFMAGGFEIIGSALVANSKDIHVAMLAPTFQFVLGCIFDKLVPLLETAEQKWLKAGKVCHCANIKTLVGLLILDLIPKPDLLVTSGQLCDTSPKTLDILNELYGIPTYYFDTCQDREFSDYPDSIRSINLCAESIRDLVKKIREVVGFELEDRMIWDAINDRSEPRRILRDLQNLIETSDPTPLCATNEALFTFFSIPLSTINSTELSSILSALLEELQNRVDRKEGAVEKGSPRILSLLPPNASDPRQDHLLCEMGIASIVTETGHFPLHGQRYIDFDDEKPKDASHSLALSLHRSMSQSLRARSSIIIEVCRSLHVDGVIARFHVGCRTVAGDPLLIKDAITKELGIPVLLLEWESFDPRVYNEEQFRRQFELFKGAMSNKKQIK